MSLKKDIEFIKSGGLLTGHDYGGKKVGVKKAVDECFDNIRVEEATVWVKEIM